VFGSGKFFQQKSMQVLFFEGSVKGLSVGAPVKFRGVDIGEVKNIELTINPNNLEFYVPVYVQIFRNRISILGGKRVGQFDNEEVVDALVTKMGLRAQLQMQSLLTGQLPDSSSSIMIFTRIPLSGKLAFRKKHMRSRPSQPPCRCSLIHCNSSLKTSAKQTSGKS
jgi:paraquat-inducible protein B